MTWLGVDVKIVLGELIIIIVTRAIVVVLLGIIGKVLHEMYVKRFSRTYYQILCKQIYLF